MQVGRYTYGAERIKVCAERPKAKIIIGSFCSIGSGIRIYVGGNHRSDWITTYPFGHINKDVFRYHGHGHPVTSGDVIIGNDVWIADNVIIMSGAVIGDGCVIANNSHVVGRLKPYGIYGGNPARLIRFRFSDDIIQKLLSLKWWDWPEDKINKVIHILCSNKIQCLNEL